MTSTAATTAAIMIADLLHHPDRGDHRVEREDDVEGHDLREDGGVGGRHPRRLLALVALELVVDLVRALRDQEEAADDQDEVAPADLAAPRAAP